MKEIPKPPPLPREDPKTAPPPEYAGRRYVSAEMQRVADSDAPPDVETELAALRAEVNASHEKIAEIERGHARLSKSDVSQNKDISAAIQAANEARAAALALAPSNDLGARAAQQAVNGLAGLDAKTLATLIITVLGFLLAGAKALKSDPPPAPTPVLVTLQTSAPAPPLPMVRP